MAVDAVRVDRVSDFERTVLPHELLLHFVSAATEDDVVALALDFELRLAGCDLCLCFKLGRGPASGIGHLVDCRFHGADRAAQRT